jgi:hypothetical protein
MKLHLLFAAFLALVSAVPLCGQGQPQSEVESLLRAASTALDHYQQLAPSIHCEEATTAELRDACKNTLGTLADRVPEAREKIARSRQSSPPQVLDLFDAYESFRRVMAVVEDVNYMPAPYGEHNRVLFAKAYNTFVKVDAWFGGVVRQSIQTAEGCSSRGRT